MYTLPLNHFYDRGVWILGRNWGTALASIKAVLIIQSHRLRGVKDCRINVFVTMEAIKATKAQPC